MNKKQLALALAGAWIAYKAYRRARRYDLNRKNVIVTGGSRGLGLMLARELLDAGCRVTVCARDADELARAWQSSSPTQRSRLLACQCDVADSHQVQALVREVRRRFGPIDVLINNAGAISVGPIEEMDYTDYGMSMRVHLWGPLNTIEAVLPEMRRRGQGRIVNIVSIGGKISVPHLVPYCAGKFALVGLSQGLRAELAREGIVVTTVCPGLMRTGSPRNALFKGHNSPEYTWFHLGDALPLVSMSAERAARQIIAALVQGKAEVVLSLPAKAAVAFHGLFPGLSADILGMANRLLPGPGGIGRARARGSESENFLTGSFLTGLSQAAGKRNNEYEPNENHHRLGA